ncbi:MAG: hypothetical protein JNL72_09910 [Flavipsychrobacter sp.]|nr:hypothetical protein [Flavipsychrobacter sp.]
MSLKTLLCLILPLAVSAKRDSTYNTIMGGYYHLSLEVPNINNSGMITQLRSLGYPAPEPPSVVPGMGFQWHFDHAIINFSYLSGSRREKTDTTFARQRYRSFEFNVGYDVLHTLKFSLYPYAGFKTCALNYKFHEKLADSTPVLGQYLGSNLDYKELSSSRIHFDLGVGFAFRSFYLVNLRAGYLLPLERTEWFIPASKTTITGGPGTKFGTYVSLVIGLGNISDDKTNRARAEQRRRWREEHPNETRLR